MTNDMEHEQEQNTAKLVMTTFFKVAKKDATTASTTASEIANYLQDKFGDVWKVSALLGKAEETLKRSAMLGFLERHGDRYLATLTRQAGCCRRRSRRRHRRRRRSCRRRRRSCRRGRRRRSCRRRRSRRRRKRPCCCSK